MGDQLYDLTQNAIEAGANRIEVEVVESGSQLRIVVKDNGRGMDEQQVRRALDPFVSDGRKHGNRRVGLGLPFLKQTVEGTGGAMNIVSQAGKGTAIEIDLDLRHLDLPAVGDWSRTLTGLLAFQGTYEMELRRERDGREYRVSRSQLAETLGDLDSAVSLALARDYIASCEEAVNQERENHGPHDT